MLANGKIHAAPNVENSSYPLSVCAERNAVAVAIAAGAKRIDAVAIVGGAKRPAAPCGGCRQVLAEFCAPDTPLVYATPDGHSVTTTVGALLPNSFGMSDLMEAGRESTGNLRGPSGISRSAARVRGTRNTGR